MDPAVLHCTYTVEYLFCPALDLSGGRDSGEERSGVDFRTVQSPTLCSTVWWDAYRVQTVCPGSPESKLDSG